MRSSICIVPFSILLIGCAAGLTRHKGDEMKKELRDMAEVDQIAAFIPQGKYKDYTGEQWHQFKDSVFSTNKKKAEAMFTKYGFLGYDKVGKEGSTQFWLIIQHCDRYPEFQANVLRAMDKEVRRGNATPASYALLYDRVKVNAGERQLFGTQVTYETQTTGRAIVKIGLIDSTKVDERRKEYGLATLKSYLNEMTTRHFEMNRQHYEQMGITKPNLY